MFFSTIQSDPDTETNSSVDSIPNSSILYGIGIVAAIIIVLLAISGRLQRWIGKG